MSRDKGRTFFGSAVNVSGNALAMPVELFGSIGIVKDFHGDRSALLKAKQRSWELPVVRGYGDKAFGSYLHDRVLDMQHVVGSSGTRLWGQGIASDLRRDRR